ncbi:MAG: hypothetical protein JNK02_14285 [Planctomycetes bacterium]|nr:hypothetical protein [Planctomycetota bacterium]
MSRLAATFALAIACSGVPAAAAPVTPGGKPEARPAPRAGSRDEIARAGAPAQTAEVVRLAARSALVERLNQLAAWCNEKELFVERDRIWRKVIEIAPDDAAARKGLRYARNVDGSWKEPAPRELKNLGKKWLDELPRREAEAYTPYADTLFDLARQDGRAPAERDGLVAEILALVPNHAALNAWLGRVPLGERWVLPETATAKERRLAIRAEARRVLEVGVPLAAQAPTPAEAALGVPWARVLQGDHVRVVSTASEEETVRIGRAVEGAGALLASVLGAEMHYPGAYTIYVLAGEGEKSTFLANLPGVSDEDRARLARLEGTGVPGTNDVALFARQGAGRVDAAVRHTIGHLLAKSVGVSHATAWAWEGLGLYLTRELVGTRLTWFVSETADPVASGLRGRLMDPETNFIQESYDLLATGRSVPLEDLLRRGLDQLDVAGALTGYALVAYLLEGRPDVVLEFVRRSARGDAPAAITGELLGRTPAEVQERLVQWLSERR